MPTPRWPWWHQTDGPDDYRIRELLRAVWDLHALYGQHTWLWRGQPNYAHDLTAGMHTRVAAGGLANERVVECTTDLIGAARDARLDLHEDARLPDLALLAMLQHHGAATPLLDVSLDPLVALYMAVVSPNPADDDNDGVLFAIRRPQSTLMAFDSGPFNEVYDQLPDDAAVLYTAPDVSERLRIQRGHFLLAKVADKFRTTLPLTIDNPSQGLANAWIYKLMAARGVQGQPAVTSDVAVFRVTAKFKSALRVWLEARSGLTPAFVLPTAWHRPHLDAFCSAHGRGATWP
ncbi:MAG: hypothetical protein GIKADHBN_03020 [Phycisphaerales bacterium]|nr:hypothetical protein [Phycisphaerales bacterium]